MPEHGETGGRRLLPGVWMALGVLSAVAVLPSWSLLPKWGIPSTPFTTLLFLLAAASSSQAGPARFRLGVVAGLAFSALGDAFLMQRGDYFVAGLGSFLVAHLWYIWAFTADSRLAEHKLPLLIWAVFGVALVVYLWPGVSRPLRLPVCLYSATLLMMAAQAASRALSKRDLPAVLAAIGGALFVASDSFLAIRRFVHPLEWGRFLVLGTYFGAQAGIALSVVLRHAPSKNR